MRHGYMWGDLSHPMRLFKGPRNAPDGTPNVWSRLHPTPLVLAFRELADMLHALVINRHHSTDAIDWVMDHISAASAEVALCAHLYTFDVGHSLDYATHGYTRAVRDARDGVCQGPEVEPW